jgi:hypothetical protein
MLEGPIEPLEPMQPGHGYNPMYIKIVHHPHSGVSKLTIIPIEGDVEESESAFLDKGRFRVYRVSCMIMHECCWY